MSSGNLRRSNRKLQNKGVFAIELRPRGPLQRKRHITVVTTNEENTDEGSPEKVSKILMENENEDQNNRVEMDVGVYEDQNQEMSSEDESENYEASTKVQPPIQEKSIIRTLRVGNLETEEMKVFLQRQRNACQKSKVPELPKLTGGGDTVHGSPILSRDPTGSASVNLKPPENKTDILTVRSSIRAYRNKMEEKARAVSGADLQDRYKDPCVKGHATHIHKTNNIRSEKQPLHHTTTESREQVITKAGSASPSRADCWGLLRWLKWTVFLLSSLALGLMGYQHLPSSSTATELQNRLLYCSTFETHLAELKLLFPSQRPDLWKRTEIHLKHHINLTNPTEPVSLMLAAGREAEKTLGCLAEQLAVAFSSTFNSTILSIDGTSKSEQDSDQVKLDIDNALKVAFGSGMQAAVIHRFEELPSGSALIFYRYCDHENAAFKKVFLVFTVMLDVPELNAKLDLRAVEEQVHQHLNMKFVSTEGTVGFSKMDVDKLSGLWSRISHVILPVAAEKKIEQHGCKGN